jgi:Tfp pilus assembly protein PilO
VGLLVRVIKEKRAVLAALAVAIAANLAAYAFVVYPMQGRVATGEARARGVVQAQRLAERDLATARATQTGKQAAEVELQKFYHQVLPDNLANARKAAYVRLAQLAAESNLRYQGQRADEERDKGSHLTKLKLTIVLDGSYQDVRRFIHAVETAPEFLVIDNMALTTHNEPNSPLFLTLAVSTYFWTTENAT